MKKRVGCSLVFLFLATLNLKAQSSVSFFEEHIDFSIDSQYFNVNGIYSFYNISDQIVNQDILFPFAVKTTLIDSIRIINLNNLEKIQFKCLENAIYFHLTHSPKDTLDINIFYRQKVAAKNTYIITTTQIWGKPLDKAIYRLTSPQTMPIQSFSYIPDSMKIVDDKNVFFWDKYHFAPQIDFDIKLDSIQK